MTAIAGYWSLGGGHEPRAQCERMLKAQRIYGQSTAPCHVAGDLAIGRRLFPTLPEDAFDKGPIPLADGGALVADVRLDNRDDLCRMLGLSPADARTMCDAALLGRALDRWDEGALQHVVGDFAFAAWNPRASRLTLARDYLGQRPLHYHAANGFLAFASMPKGLHALAEIPLAANPHAAADFLAIIPESGDESFFAGIAKVAPGHVVTVDKGGVSARRYWEPAPRPLRLPTADDYAQAMRERMDEAVSSRLRAIAPGIGSHLSGGLDSSAVTATAARLLQPKDGRVVAYTSVPHPGSKGGETSKNFVDEGPLAAAVAGLYPNIDHVRVCIDGASPLASLERNFFLYERPYLNLCNGTWVDAINDDAKARSLGIMLVGSMGNAGFSYSGMHRLPQLLRRGRLADFAREALALRRSGTAAETIAAAAIGPFVPSALWRLILRLRGQSDALAGHSAIRSEWMDDPGLLGRARSRGVDFSYQPMRDPAAAQMSLLGRVDAGNYNKGVLAGWGLDIRDPTADRRLMEFCLSVPVEHYLSGGKDRALARRSMADRLPAAVTNETRKGYQGANWHEGLTAARGDIADELEWIARDPAAADLIDLKRLGASVSEWPSDGWHSQANVDAYRLALLRGVSIGHFMRKAAGTN